jgi:two-component system OmpR family sensor kinase
VPDTPGLRQRLALVPLRVRLVAAVLVLASLALAVSAVFTTSVLRGYLLDQTDKDLRTAAQAPGATDFTIVQLPSGVCRVRYDADDDPRGGGRGGFGPAMRPGQANPLARYYTVYTDSSGVSCATPGPVDDPDPDVPTALPTDRAVTVDAVSGGGTWRVVSAESGNGSRVVLATPIADVQDTVHRLLVIQGLVSLAVLAGLAGAAYAVVRGSLRPLREVEQTAAVIASEHASGRTDVSRRVPRQDDRTEVGRLATAFNSMLGSIEASFAGQRESEAAAQASEAQARESEARLRRFVGDASHELRTPLTSIRGFAELYRTGAVAPGDDLDRVMGRVEGEATRMGNLVEEMLLLARLDQQRPLETAPVDLSAIAADAVHDAERLDPTRTITLKKPRQPVVVPGDEARLRQVLVNLLGNALAHTPAGTKVEVRLSVTKEGGVLLEVQDRGPGLTPEQAQHVFDRFYRGDSSRTRAAGVPGLSGSGLGLSIVSAVAEAHGGRAGVRSTKGKGATFLVELPLSPP